MKKICFIGDLSSEFTKRDYNILKKHFKINLVDRKNILNLLKIPSNVMKSDIVFSWFASYHSFIATFFCKLFKKKLVIVAGGYDVAYLPEIKYGNFISPIGKMFSLYSFKNADVVISISKSNQKELLEKIKPKKNVLIYNGVPILYFYPQGKKENMIITVCSSNWIRKGIEDFILIANSFYKLGYKEKFVICGNIPMKIREHYNQLSYSNLRFTGRLTDDELLKYYQRSKIYLQLSIHEGFGITVAESMLCGCIPIVSDNFALPEILGDTGFVIPNECNIMEKVIIIHTLDNPQIGKKARERVIKNYSLQKREKALVKLIGDL